MASLDGTAVLSAFASVAARVAKRENEGAALDAIDMIAHAGDVALLHSLAAAVSAMADHNRSQHGRRRSGLVT